MKYKDYTQKRKDRKEYYERKMIEYQERLNVLDIPDDVNIYDLGYFFRLNNFKYDIYKDDSIFMPQRYDNNSICYAVSFTKESGFMILPRIDDYVECDKDISDDLICRIERCFNNEPPEPEYHRPWWEIFKDKWEMFWRYSITGFILKVVFTIIWIGSALGMFAFLLRK